MPNILELKYHSIAVAKGNLGDMKSIRDIFIGFQEYRYKTHVI